MTKLPITHHQSFSPLNHSSSSRIGSFFLRPKPYPIPYHAADNRRRPPPPAKPRASSASAEGASAAPQEGGTPARGSR